MKIKIDFKLSDKFLIYKFNIIFTEYIDIPLENITTLKC